VGRVVAISNSVFLMEAIGHVQSSRKRLSTLGFISNIAPEKGIWEVLRLASACQTVEPSLGFRIAGPFQDAETERGFWVGAEGVNNIEYVGAVYGAEKERFFESIDVLLFPTVYANEAEPLVVLEALSYGIPVLAYDRGAIRERVASGAGVVVDRDGDFVQEALKRIEAWVSCASSYEQASQKAIEASERLCRSSAVVWSSILHEILVLP